MATVPTLTSNRIQSRPDATPFQNASTVLGAMAAKGQADQQVLNNLAQGLNKIDIEIQKNEIQENERYAKEMDNEFTSYRRQLLFGSDDGTVPGFYSLNGASAVDAAPGVKQQIEAKRQEIEGRARTEKAKQMFSLAAAQRINTEFRELNRFTVKEQHVAQITASDTRVKEAIDDAVLGWNNPSVLINSLSTIAQEVQAVGELQGWDAETMQSQLESKRTLLYSGVITSMLQQGDDVHAREFFKTVENQMDAPDAAAIAEKVDNATLFGSIQRESSIIAVVDGSWAEKIALVRDSTEYTDEQKSGIVKELRAREQEEIRATKADMKELEGDVNQTIASGGSLVEWMIANPDGAIALARDSEMMKRVESYQKMVSEGRNHPVTSDGKAATKLHTMDPHELAQVDIVAYRGVLTASEYEKAEGWIAGAQATVRRQAQSVELYNQGNRWVKEFGTQAGIEWDSDKSAHQKQQWALENEISGWIASQTPPPTSKEVKEYAEFLNTTAGTTPDDWVFPIIGAMAGGEEMSVIDVMALTPKDDGYSDASIPFNILSPKMINDAQVRFQRAGKKDYTEEDVANYWGAVLTDNIARKKEILGLSGSTAKPAPVPRKKQVDADAQFTADFQEFIGKPATPVAKPRPAEEAEAATLAKRPLSTADITTDDADIKKFAPLLDALGSIEGGTEGYEALAGGGTVVGAVDMTIADVAEEAGTKAVGMWQNLGDQIVSRAKAIGLDPDVDTYSAENQAKIAMHLLKTKRGVTDAMIKDDPDEAINRMAKEWAAIPVAKDTKRGDQDILAGESYYKGVSNNKALITVEELKAVLKQITE